ncbi:hypothetical protein Tco_0806168 [Tanacetum coccineum]
MDDLYNNLKIYETEVKGLSSSNQNSHNVAFVSSNNSGSSNQAHGSNSANTDRAIYKEGQGSKGEQEQRTCKEECDSGNNRDISFGGSRWTWVNDKYKTGEGYHAVPPPYTGNFMPPKPNLVLADEEEYVFSESIISVPVVATSKVKTSKSKPKSVSEPLIEDWISDSEDENENEFKFKQRKPSFAKVEFVNSNKHVKIPRKFVEKVENNN